MAYYGISTNLVLYFTRKLHEGTVTSSNNVTNWVGTVWLTPILGAYIADAFLGRYWTFLISSAIYLMVKYSNLIIITIISVLVKKSIHNIQERYIHFQLIMCAMQEFISPFEPT